MIPEKTANLWRLAITVLALVCLGATPMAAQQGLGKLDADSVRSNRPLKAPDVSHPSNTTVWFFRLPGGACRNEDCRNDRERSELIQSKADNIAGRAYRYTFSMYLPPDSPDVSPTNLILWQIKPHGSGKPSVTVEIREDVLYFVLHDPRALQTDNMNPLKPVVIQPVVRRSRGKWLNFEMDGLWSRGADGFIDLRRDGKTVASHRGPNVDADSGQQRVRFGLYRSFVSRYKQRAGVAALPEQKVFFTNISRTPL